MRRFGLGWFGAWVLVSMVALPVRAAELAWQSSVACDRRERVEGEATRLLGQPLSEVEFADFGVNLRAVAEGGLELRLETTPRNPALESSSRTLVGASCDELADAAALAIAMTVSAYQPPERATVPTERVEAAPPEPPPRAPILVALGASGALDVGAFPNAAFGVQVGASVRHRWFTVAPFAVFFPRATMQRDNGVGAEFRASAGGVLACAGRAYAGVTLDACLGYEVGKLHGRGTGLQRPREGSSLWSAPRAELQVAVPLIATLRMTGSAGLTVPTHREDFEIEGGLVHRPGAVTARFGLGIEFRL